MAHSHRLVFPSWDSNVGFGSFFCTCCIGKKMNSDDRIKMENFIIAHNIFNASKNGENAADVLLTALVAAPIMVNVMNEQRDDIDEFIYVLQEFYSSTKYQGTSTHRRAEKILRKYNAI